MKKLLNKTLMYFAGLFLLTMSCDDEVSVTNTNELSQATFFESLAQIEAAANAGYAQLQNSGLYQRYGYILPDTFSDEMTTSTDPNFIPSYQFRMTASLVQTSSYWTNCYNGIAACNYVIDNQEVMEERLGTSDFSAADINDAVGQARFLRGLYYFFLVKRYGGVPLLLEIQETPTGTPRSTADEIYAAIINDLQAASELLYSKDATERGRATKGAALALLGKVYLFQEEFALAKTTFEQITDYSLLPLEDYNDNFNESGEHNDESMFEVSFSGDVDESDLWSQTGLGVSEVIFHAQEYAGWGNARPSTKMINEFEDDDPRFESAILMPGGAHGPTGEFTWTGSSIIWYKFSQLYENESVTQNGDTNARILRYADVILMQAEVEHRLGNDAGAINYLNQIRARVEMPLYGTQEMDDAGYPVDTPEGVFNAIVHERMVELCAEQHRFDDLVRWNLDNQELQLADDGSQRGYNPDVHRLMPIPQVEIDSNDEIGPGDQNPGY
ncbi:RagB/SusD family nutrient uptake outer membrane protein [Flagellimonas sp. 2504JD4-2]